MKSRQEIYFYTLDRLFKMGYEQFGLIPFGEGGSVDENDKIKSFSIDFSARRTYSEQEARKLLLVLDHLIFSFINNDPLMKSVLKEGHLKHENFEIFVAVDIDERDAPKPLYIVSFYIEGDTVKYSYAEPYKFKSNYISETFEEAKAKVCSEEI